ncbi:lipoprotein, putative [Ferrimonas balearica DSM 9799]|uniref:Lipoprotein, putative n=1 Tax=Ferrimonas balearica (strain DSM 9799 / CCM 4581 / KCTC 23876 / PAT) TaxID=550540 RepID=E1SQU9_FERBD|nr:FlgO family outer membrane protein [Ferrimonas balearica]ADN76874.1 lipoprotein, putative [Ferrimonas balearica DSM 9799]MBW3140142.1 hypothetical protein [Ferrimonas balearica]MBY5979973.1 hypothetical protein [Ferrimonas balearica]MBY6106750.1 hypothetical protein [Ferrimonas balearica]
MRVMTPFLAASVLLALSGCASPTDAPDGYVVAEDGKALPPQGGLNVLAEAIARDLVRHHDNLDTTSLTAVTTPVMLEQFDQTSQFARQLGEALTSALHQQGLNLVDLNGSDTVRVTERGNLLLSRDFEKLASQLPVEQVVVATIATNREAVEIQSRIISVSNKRILSTSQSSVPWQQLPQYFGPARQVSLEQGGLYRHSAPGRGGVVELEER